MDDRRKYKRFSTQLIARYLSENEEEWKNCTVINIGRGGMGITVYVREKIPMGSSLQLEIIVPAKEEPIKVTGILRWIMEEEEEMNFSGSIEFTNILDEIELANLTYFMS